MNDTKPTAAAPSMARTRTADSSHWYYTDGRPCYELPKADGKGMKNPTLADARKLNLLPSVTTILKILAKPALQDWLIEQAVLAVLSTPRHEGEALDAFAHRVLQIERVQDQESTIARDRGTQIHDALECFAKKEPLTPELTPVLEFAKPVWDKIDSLGRVEAVEAIYVGDGYAGKTDLLLIGPDEEWLIDYKTTKKLPEKASWPEHRLQLAAYAKAREPKATKPIRTGNLYVSSLEPGKFVFWENPPYAADYAGGFAPLVTHWQWLNNYRATV